MYVAARHAHREKYASKVRDVFRKNRIDSDSAWEKSTLPSKMVVWLTRLFLFGAPITYLRYVNRLLHLGLPDPKREVQWQKYVQKLVNDWQGFNLVVSLQLIHNSVQSSSLKCLPRQPCYFRMYISSRRQGCVLKCIGRSAAVSFLAAPGIDDLTRIASLLSVLCALGSVTTGLYLAWVHQTRKDSYSAPVPSMLLLNYGIHDFCLT